MLLGLIFAAFATAILSATFGMAGGMLLMGVYTAVLSVPAAMALHGMTQVVSNGFRAWVWREHILWRIVGAYIVGALVAAAALQFISFVPSRPVVYVALGLVPFVARALGAWVKLPSPADRPLAAGITGVVVCLVQGVAGVGGPLLDVAFLSVSQDRRGVVATKAATQVVSHLVKISLFFRLSDLNLPLVGGSAVAVIAGGLVGAAILERLSDDFFRAATKWIVLGIGSAYLLMGLYALANS